MRYYSEETVKGILEQIDNHYVKELEGLPSVDIPEKHGRLIDIDRFIKEERDYYCSNCEKSICKTCWVFLVIDETDEAPTVLEANYQQVNSKQ